MRRLISTLGGMLPGSLRQPLIGTPSEPSRLANLMHVVLNQIPGERVACLPCRGVLRGYCMKIDWSRHRSYVYGTWEPEVVSALKRLVRSGQCVIDVGAHIGFYTLIFSRFVGPQGRVLAFEPLPWNFSVLCENIALNHIGHAEAINRALLDRTCDLEAKIPDDEPLPGSVPYAESGTKHATARAVSLDEYLGGSRDHVHFIKMDVEGSESLVLAGA